MHFVCCMIRLHPRGNDCFSSMNEAGRQGLCLRKQAFFAPSVVVTHCPWPSKAECAWCLHACICEAFLLTQIDLGKTGNHPGTKIHAIRNTARRSRLSLSGAEHFETPLLAFNKRFPRQIGWHALTGILHQQKCDISFPAHKSENQKGEDAVSVITKVET